MIVRNEDRNEVKPMRWDLVPSWAPDPSIGNRMINARAELLGHASIIMTEISTHVAIRKVKMVHVNKHPRGVRGIIDYGTICDEKQEKLF